VNLPCHLVIVKGTEFFDTKQCRYVDMPVTDVLQMMGRAGRPQFDATGTACIFVHEPKKTFYKKFLHEPFPVESSLHLQLHDHLNAEIATGSLHTVRDCIEYLSWTYYFRRLMMNPGYYGLAGDDDAGGEISAEAVERHLVALVALVASELCAAGCVELDDGATKAITTAAAIANNTSFSCTYLGRIASLYYLTYRTPGIIRARLLAIDAEDFSGAAAGRRNLARYQIWQLLLLLCDAPEFAEVPVRHCEDELNHQLAAEITAAHGERASDPESLLAFLTEHSSYDSAHCKAFLLLLAHMEGSPLPISDYITDTKMVLDQVARVLKAMIDVAAEEELLDIVLRLLLLSQLLVQGLAVASSELQQLPGVTAGVTVNALKNRGVSSLRQLARFGPEKLRQLAASVLAGGGDGNPASKRRGGANKAAESSDYENSVKVTKFMQVCANLPDIVVQSVTLKRSSSDTADVVWQCAAGEQVTECSLVAGASYELTVQISGAGGRDAARSRRDRSAAVHSNKPHKLKQASWYLTTALTEKALGATGGAPAFANVQHSEVLRDRAANTLGDLLALKQLGSLTDDAAALQISFLAPTEAEADLTGASAAKDLTVVLMCDSIAGLDCAVKLPVRITMA
jgi:hypothetical protein